MGSHYPVSGPLVVDVDVDILSRYYDEGGEGAGFWMDGWRGGAGGFKVVRLVYGV